MMSSYARTIGAILGFAILFPMAFAAFAYPTVVSQGMTILKLAAKMHEVARF